jgi:hypothetical protein
VDRNGLSHVSCTCTCTCTCTCICGVVKYCIYIHTVYAYIISHHLF